VAPALLSVTDIFNVRVVGGCILACLNVSILCQA
jgi:hypothetical protein